MTKDNTADKDADGLAPTVTKVLDEYQASLKADGSFDDDVTGRLDALLRKGKVPKADDIDAALFPQDEKDQA